MNKTNENPHSTSYNLVLETQRYCHVHYTCINALMTVHTVVSVNTILRAFWHIQKLLILPRPDSRFHLPPGLREDPRRYYLTLNCKVRSSNLNLRIGHYQYFPLNCCRTLRLAASIAVILCTHLSRLHRPKVISLLVLATKWEFTMLIPRHCSLRQATGYECRNSLHRQWVVVVTFRVHTHSRHISLASTVFYFSRPQLTRHVRRDVNPHTYEPHHVRDGLLWGMDYFRWSP